MTGKGDDDGLATLAAVLLLLAAVLWWWWRAVMVAAPMPGTVLVVSAEVGQVVADGDVLGVMEAMKMELSLKAPVAGTVAEVGAATGDQVALGATLFVVTADLSEGDDVPATPRPDSSGGSDA